MELNQKPKQKSSEEPDETRQRIRAAVAVLPGKFFFSDRLSQAVGQ